MSVDRFRIVPAAYVLLLRAGPDGGPGQVLLHLRQNTGFHDGYWASAAAGHVEEGESVVAAACREAREEVGVELDGRDLVPLTVMHRRHSSLPIDQRVDFFFTVRRWLGEPRRMEPHKSIDLRWFPLDRLPDRVVPHELFVLRGLLAGDLPGIVTFGFAPAAGA